MFNTTSQTVQKNAVSTWVFRTGFGLSVLALAVSAAFFVREIDAHSNTRQQLADTQSQLRKADSELADTQSQLRKADSELADANGRILVLNESVATGNRLLEAARADNSSLRGQVNETNSNLVNVRAQLASTLTEKDGLSAQLSQVQKNVQALQVTNASLQSRVTALETEQSKYYVGTFACSGSMEPYITCADDAVWKRAFVPSDIKVGTVISFREPPGCTSGSGHTTAHRVIEIRTQYGSLAYLTKGDNNRTSDPCLVPLAYVDSVLALLRKNTRPENVIDTTEHRIAIQQLNAIQDQRDSVQQQYEAALADYGTEDDRLCGYARYYNRTCFLSSSNLRYLSSLQSWVETLRQRFNQLVAEYNSKAAQTKAIQCRLFKACT